MSKTYAHIGLAAGHSKGCEQMHAFRVARGYMIHGAQCITRKVPSYLKVLPESICWTPPPLLSWYYLISQDSTGNHVQEITRVGALALFFAGQWRNPGVQGDPLCTFPRVGDDYRFLEKINRFSIGFLIWMVFFLGSMPHFLINSYGFVWK